MTPWLLPENRKALNAISLYAEPSVRNEEEATD